MWPRWAFLLTRFLTVGWTVLSDLFLQQSGTMESRGRAAARLEERAVSDAAFHPLGSRAVVFFLAQLFCRFFDDEPSRMTQAAGRRSLGPRQDSHGLVSRLWDCVAGQCPPTLPSPGTGPVVARAEHSQATAQPGNPALCSLLARTDRPQLAPPGCRDRLAAFPRVRPLWFYLLLYFHYNSIYKGVKTRKRSEYASRMASTRPLGLG